MLTGDMLRRSAARFPDKTAVIWGESRLRYRDFDTAANRLAHALLDLGLAKGAKVAILSRNRTEYAIAFFGSARAGTVLVNVSVLYAPAELAYVLDKADAEVLIFEDLFAEKVAEVRDALPGIRHYVVLGDSRSGRLAGGARSFDDLLKGRPGDEPKIAIDERDPFCMTYTGGTTGRPKGVLVSHRARAVTAHTVVVEERLESRDVVAIVTPMFHVAALNIMFQPAILVGATVSLLAKWDVADFRRLVARDRVTAAFMVPTQATMLVQAAEFDAAELASWRKLSFAGAPMPDWVQRALMEKLPGLRLTQIYGQSEMGVIAALPHWRLPEKLGSVGRMPFNADIACVDPDGRPVPPGEIGELVSRGDNLMIEYYGEPEQTAAFFRHGDGWGWSGDLGTIDADGFVTLIDRSKEMIISGGENIYPKEIENALYEHPSVAECAVFGIPDDHFGEVPAAHVALKSGAGTSVGELEAHCTSRLARFKRPRLIVFVETFPKTAIGKIQKTVIRDAYWQGRDREI
ncbi:long-chain-fatty-acid--CoA ligase [Oceanibacterium hippocampi]|uniref:3-methylmercaptopropionyl-CoA ligase n=1 Tax=Oceanibacterium hippocampi TaxID=745714 RepID=A0A1Y5RA28_9PROT|nr:long-chain-fatty-acid--CoA ligase [Oceanibacterium hippocampi]SLN12631.1 Long-chain-fatty-acid--CoA ligase [Oceanibacterium hippocampi]